MDFIKWLDFTFGKIFTPQIIGILITIGTIIYRINLKLINNIEKTHSDMIEKASSMIAAQGKDTSKEIKELKKEVNEVELRSESRFKDINKEVIRLQILEGIADKRLSLSELNFFYTKYQQMGGNSFVTKRVNDYAKELEENGYGKNRS